jgi:hypothetical protein
MLARNARKADVDALDKLLDANALGDVRLDRDVIVVAGAPPNGALVWRPSALVHEFVCPGRLTANALVNYAVGQGAGRTVTIRDVVFLVDPSNESMLRYTKALGAVEYSGKVFTLDVG